MSITGKNTLNHTCIIEVDSDPRISIEENCPIGSIAIWNDGLKGKLFKKSSALNLDWRETRNNYFSAYLSTNVTFFNDVPAPCPYDIENLNTDNTIFSFNNLTGELTVLGSRLYEVNYDAGVVVITNDRTLYRHWLELNGVEVSGTSSFTYNRNTAQGSSGVSMTIPLTLNANDILTVISQNVSGGNGNDGAFIGNACRLNVKALVE